jgi:hypothetical protein
MNENKTARVLAWRAQEIPAQIEQAFAEAVDPETGEIVDETALQKIEALTAQKTVAVTDLAWFVKQADTVMIAHLDAVMAELKARKARIEKARDIGQKVLESCLTPGEKSKQTLSLSLGASQRPWLSSARLSFCPKSLSE